MCCFKIFSSSTHLCLILILDCRHQTAIPPGYCIIGGSDDCSQQLSVELPLFFLAPSDEVKCKLWLKQLFQYPRDQCREIERRKENKRKRYPKDHEWDILDNVNNNFGPECLHDRISIPSLSILSCCQIVTYIPSLDFCRRGTSGKKLKHGRKEIKTTNITVKSINNRKYGRFDLVSWVLALLQPAIRLFSFHLHGWLLSSFLCQ